MQKVCEYTRREKKAQTGTLTRKVERGDSLNILTDDNWCSGSVDVDTEASFERIRGATVRTWHELDKAGNGHKGHRDNHVMIHRNPVI